MEMEKDYEKNWVRLPLVFASNVRELGGYPVEEGGQTAYHRFLRADDISELSESDIQFLLRYGVTSVLDLRSDGEVCRKPDVLAGVSGVLWKNVPFLRGEAGDMSRYAGEGAVADLGEMYLSLIHILFCGYRILVKKWRIWTDRMRSTVLFPISLNASRSRWKWMR